MGSFFNKQDAGVRLKDIQRDQRLRTLMNPLATIHGSADIDNELSMLDQRNIKYMDEDEFVAIAEGTELPFYFFTYNIEMIQFVYTDFMENEDQIEVIDKSIPARHHAQFIAQQIADEARLNNHKFQDESSIFMKLIRHHKIASIEYPKEEEDEDVEFPLP
jgi:alpha-acetolactate decarboxylase